MSDVLWISTGVAMGAGAIAIWVTRNLFAALNLALFWLLMPFVGCVLIADRDPRAERIAFLVASGVMCMALGGLAANRWYRHNPHQELRVFQSKKVESLFVSNAMFSWTLVSFIILGCLVVMVFFIRAGVPLLSESLGEAKVEAARTGGYLPVRFMRLYLPLLMMIYFTGYRVKVRPNRLLIGSTAVFILVAFTLFGYRSYILNYFLIPFLFLLAYRKVSKRLLLFLGAAAVGSAIGITASAYHESSFRSLWEILSQRLFVAVVVEGLEPIVHYLVPTRGYMYGRGFWMDIPAALSRVGLGPPGQESFGQYLVRLTAGENYAGWQTASTLTGEAYANFGIPGIVTIMFMFGFFVQWLHIRILRGPKDPFLFPLKIYLQLSLWIAAGGPFVFTLIDSIGSLTIFALVFVSLYIFWSLPFGGPRFRRLSPQGSSTVLAAHDGARLGHVPAAHRGRDPSPGGAR